METKKELEESLKLSLPKIIDNEKCLKLIIGILSEKFYDEIVYDNDGENTIETIMGLGDYGEFPITIREFCGVFWVSAPEFDDIGFFTNKEDAVSYANINYEPFVSEYMKQGNKKTRK